MHGVKELSGVGDVGCGEREQMEMSHNGDDSREVEEDDRTSRMVIAGNLPDKEGEVDNGGVTSAPTSTYSKSKSWGVVAPEDAGERFGLREMLLKNFLILLQCVMEIVTLDFC